MAKSERLKAAINVLGLLGEVSNYKDVAEKMSADPSNVSRHLKGKPEPSDKFMTRFNEAFGNKFNLQWLLDGEGEMFADEKENNKSISVNLDSHEKITVTNKSNAVLSMPVEEMEYVCENSRGAMFLRDNLGRLLMSVPHVPYAARAEFTNLSDRLEPMFTGTHRELYAVDKKVRGKYLSFEVKGDSMDDGSRNSLQDGDKVLVRELEHDFWKDLHLHNHRYWVLVFGTSVLIKQIIKADSTSGEIICHSLNPSPEYADFTLNLDDVRMLYYVVKIKPREISL